jgi:hypothetical protein
LSRDRDRIVFVTGGMSRSEFWVHDLERDFSTPAFKRDGFSMNMVWLPDGRIGVSSFMGTVGTFAHELTGRNEPELISDDIIAAVSRDGRHYVRSTMRMPNFDDPGVHISGPDFDAEPIVTLRDGDSFVRLSRDDDWMLFESERTGTDQLYLSRFPPDGDQDWPVALTGSDDAWFRDDLSAIYYVENDREKEQTTVFRVALTVEPEVRLGVPEVVQEFSSSTRVTDFDGDDRLLVVTGAARGASRVYIDTGFSTRE